MTVDEETMALLVGGRLAWEAGDREIWEYVHVQARQRLHAQGLTRAQAADAMTSVGGEVTERANAALDELAGISLRRVNDLADFDAWRQWDRAQASEEQR